MCAFQFKIISISDNLELVIHLNNEIEFLESPSNHESNVGFNLNLLSNEILKFQLTGFPNYYLMKKEDHPETVREETILHTRSLEDDYKVCY